MYSIAKALQEKYEQLLFTELTLHPPPLQKHLSDEDFTTVFQMSKDVFNTLPQWRQLDSKKKHCLF